MESDGSHDHKPEQTVNISEDKIYLNRLNSLVYNICEHYVQYISEKKSNLLIDHLYSLVIDFDTKSFFSNLNKKMKLTNPNARLVDIYFKVLQPWLTSQELCCKHVISLIFLLFEYLEIEDKKTILTTFSEVSTTISNKILTYIQSILNLFQVPSEECLSWCISEALSHPHNKDTLVKEWLRTDRISKFIVTITDKIILDKCPPELGTLFKLALTENEHGGN